MGIGKRVALWLSIRWYYAKSKVHDGIFWLRKTFYVKKYGTGDNMPPEVLNKLAGDGENPMIALMIAHNEVCAHLSIDHLSTRFLSRVKWLANNEVPTIEDRIYGLGLLDEVLHVTEGRSLHGIILRELINNNDIEWHQVPQRFVDEEAYENFRKLCGM